MMSYRTDLGQVPGLGARHGGSFVQLDALGGSRGEVSRLCTPQQRTPSELVSGILDRGLRAVLPEAFSPADLRRYRDLALATGGSFVQLDMLGGSHDERSAFLRRIKITSKSENERLRVEAKDKYRQQLALGTGTSFDWYKG